MKKVFFLLVIVILLIIINNTISSIRILLSNEHSLTTLTQSLQDQKQQHNFLKQQLYYVKTNDFVEREARNKLGMVKPGEHIVIAPLPQKTTIPTQIGEDSQNWQKWIRLFL